MNRRNFAVQAEADEPPRISRLGQVGIVALFNAAVQTQCRPHVGRDPDARPAPGTIVVFNHQSDLDGPFAAAAVFDPPTLRRWGGHVQIMFRSELFLDGFLALRFPEIGALLPRLRRANIGPIMMRLGFQPVGKAGPRLVAAWLADLTAAFGPNQPAADLIAPAWLERHDLTGGRRGLAIGEVVHVARDRLLGLEADAEFLTRAAAQRLRGRDAMEARRRLNTLAAGLRAGRLLVLAPEGQLTPDGSLQPFRSGLYRLVQARQGASILPVGISYDLLDGQRPFAWARLGPLLTRVAAHSRHDLEALVRGQIARLITVTAAQLVGAAVYARADARPVALDAAALAHEVRQRAADLLQQGRPVDERLLAPAAAHARLTALLHAARPYGLRLADGAIQLDWPRLSRLPAARAENPLAFARNQLASVEAAIEHGRISNRAVGGTPHAPGPSSDSAP